jgi:hypothetical protein
VEKVFKIKLADNSRNEQEDESEYEEIEEHADGKLWNRTTTLFLIEKIEEAEKQFENSVKKNVWVKIAQQCTKEFSRNFTYNQCDSKWKSLKRTYKSILLHNQTTGKNRRQWEFYSAIDKFMYKRPEISPSATCSSRKGLECTEEEEDTADAESFSNNVDSEKSEFESSFTKKRRAKMSSVEIRHREKMARQDRFNDLFEKMIEKL